MSYELTVNRPSGYLGLTSFQFSTNYPDAKIFDFGDGTTILTNDNIVDHVYTKSGEFLVSIRPECSKYNTRDMVLVVTVAPFVENEIEITKAPLSGYSSIEDGERFNVSVRTNCEPPITVRLEVDGSSSKEIIDGGVRDNCQPAHYFFSSEGVDEFGTVSISDVNEIEMNGNVVGWSTDFCFGFYDDVAGNVDITTTLDVGCDLEFISDGDTDFYECLQVDGDDITSFFTNNTPKSDPPNMSDDRVYGKYQTYDTIMDLSDVQFRLNECVAVQEDTDVKDVFNSFVAGGIRWRTPYPPKSRRALTREYYQGRDMRDYASFVGSRDAVTGDYTFTVEYSAWIDPEAQSSSGAVNNVTLTFTLKRCDDCCGAIDPVETNKVDVYIGMWYGMVAVHEPTHERPLAIDDTIQVQYPAGSGQTYFANPHGAIPVYPIGGIGDSFDPFHNPVEWDIPLKKIYADEIYNVNGGECLSHMLSAGDELATELPFGSQPPPDTDIQDNATIANVQGPASADFRYINWVYYYTKHNWVDNMVDNEIG